MRVKNMRKLPRMIANTREHTTLGESPCLGGKSEGCQRPNVVLVKVAICSILFCLNRLASKHRQ